MTDPVATLARRLVELERTVRSSNAPQLSHSSIETGALTEYDEDTLVGQYGMQYDGTHTAASLGGPPPPQPTPPIVQSAGGGLLVGWDGEYAGGIFTVAPMDWLRVDIAVGPVGFDPIATPPVTAITSPRGGLAFVPLEPGEYEVYLIVRSESGKASPVSISRTDTALPLADATEVAAAAEAANQAAADALAAQLRADDAFDLAGSADGSAGLAYSIATAAQDKANAAITVFRQSSQPSTGMEANDLWIDADDGLLYVYVGSTWTLSADQRIAAVVTSNASKITVFAQTSAPSTSGRTFGDLWIDIDDGNHQYVWEGSWVDRRDATIAAAASLATAAKNAADGKMTVFRQTSAPAWTGRIAGDLWIDDTGLLYTFVVGSGWQAAPDQRIATALTNAYTAQQVAEQTDAINRNPSFQTWDNLSAAPNDWSWYATGGAPGTAFVRTGVRSLRWNVAATESGAYTGLDLISPAEQYLTVTVDLLVHSGSLAGSGVLVDWNTAGGTDRAVIDFATEVGVVVPEFDKWLRVSKVVKRPMAFAGAATSLTAYLMANHVGIRPVAVKDIYFQRFAVRPSTAAEVAAYNAAPQSTVTTLTSTVSGKTTVFYQASPPSTTGRTLGDLWIDSDDNDKTYRWGGSWIATDLASEAYIASRGTNLVTNGTGLLGNNTNWSALTFDKTDMPTGAAGSFTTALGQAVNPFTDEIIPVDVTKKFRLSFSAKQRGPSTTSQMYGCLLPMDAFGLGIDPNQYMFTAGTTTTLAVALNPGATTVTLTSSANWYGSAGKPAGTSTWLRSIIFWDYTDAGGKVWPEETYSRNVTAADLYADGGISGNVITLRAPYAGPAKPAGTKVSNGSSGGTYIYGGAVATAVPKAWTAYAADIQGVALGGQQAQFGAGWPSGTAQCRVGFLMNFATDQANSRHAVALVSFSDAAAAQAAADAAGILASGKATIYRQSSAPATGQTNDMWVDADDGLLYVWTGSWTPSADQRIATVVSSNATKITAFAQTSAPSTSGRVLGDIWVDTDDGNKIYVWDGAWTPRLLGAPAIGATARQLGAVLIYRQSTMPVSGMVNGDMWIDSDDGLVYVYVTSTWVVSDDQRIGGLVTSNSTKISMFAQTSAPATTGRVIGDIWIDTDDGNKIYDWASPGAWTGRLIGGTALAADAIDGKTITGALIRTAATGERIALNQAAKQIEFYSSATDLLPVVLRAQAVGSTYTSAILRSAYTAAGGSNLIKSQLRIDNQGKWNLGSYLGTQAALDADTANGITEIRGDSTGMNLRSAYDIALNADGGTYGAGTGKVTAGSLLVAAAGLLVGGGTARYDLNIKRLYGGGTSTSETKTYIEASGTLGYSQPVQVTTLVRDNVERARSELTEQGLNSPQGLQSGAMRPKFFDGDGSAFATTSLTGVAMGASGAQGTFVAPPSGIVEVTVASQLRTVTTVGQSAIVGFEIKDGAVIGSGGSIQAFDANKAVLNANLGQVRSERTYQVTGLTAGATYNIRTICATTSAGSQAQAAWNSLIVRPSL